MDGDRSGGLVDRLQDLARARPRFEGATALVSGAGSGIGEATARRLAGEGARVVVFDVDGAAAERVAGEIGAVAFAGDAADPGDAQRAVEAAADADGGLDVLVACPGSDIGSAPLLDTTDEGWEAGLHVNLHTAAMTTRAALPALLRRRGSIVVISSIGGLASAPDNTVYQTVKAGLLAFVRSLAVDYGDRGVRANAVCPGWTMTPTATKVISEFAAAMGMSGQAAYDQATSVIPLRRAAEPAELAAACAFLASADASFVTGATVVVDGGTTAISAGASAFEAHPPG